MICFSQVGWFLRTARFQPNIKKLLLLVWFVFFLGSSCFATTYTTSGTGTWDANGAPPNPLLNGDIVNVNHTGVYYDWPNTVTIESGATFNINGGGSIELLNLVIDNGGAMNVNAGAVLRSVGSITNNSDNVVIDGELTDNDSFTNNGAITGTGTISVGNPPAAGSGTINGTDMDDYDWSEEVNMSESLPVTLVAFRAYSIDGNIMLTWSTSSEINNNYFTIERSTGEEWSVIAEIAGAGNTTDIKTYSYIDRRPLQGKSFYRLKQTDFDGQFEYFEPIAVTLASAHDIQINRGSNEIKGWPNTPWHLYDLKGNLKLSGQTDTFGFSALSESLSPGLYIFRMADFTLKVCWK